MPVCSRMRLRMWRPSTPSPWKEYGDVRGLKAEARMISSPRSRSIRAESRPCDSLSSAQGPPKITRSLLPSCWLPIGILVLDFR